MPTLSRHLATLAYRDLRGIAARLGVSQRGQHRKNLWRAALVQGWQDAAQRQAWVAQLSPAAQAALLRLLLVAQLPHELFVAEYGAVRRVTTRQPWSPPPWQAPQTPAEELYYAGLLATDDARPWPKARFVLLPSDLRPLLQAELGNPTQVFVTTTQPIDQPLDVGEVLVHDVGQLLIYLHATALHPATQPRLQAGRWLTRPHLRSLNQRLYQPEPTPLPRTHKQTARLRNLMFLATAAELQQQGNLTPLAWAWLGEPPLAQVALLWRGWQAATPVLRHSYAQPDAHLPPPWPAPLVAALRASPTPFTPALLSAQLLNVDADLRPYWLAHLADLTDLDQLLATLCATVLRDLGLVVQLAAEPTPLFQVTTLGHWLLGEPVSPPFGPNPAFAPAQLVADDTHWQLTTPALALLAQAQLAPYAEYGRLTRTPVAQQHYQLDATTVGHAVAVGLGLPELATACVRLNLTLTPAHWQQLYAWQTAGRSLTLGYYALLRTSTPDQLQALTETPALQALIGELLSPTIAVLQQTVTASAQALRNAGYPAVTPVDQGGQGDPQNGALWLAGQLYALLGQHMPLPLPPPFAALHALYQQLPAAQQALVQSQLAQGAAHLLDLLDVLPFTPPPQPSDPAQWQPLIQQAIDTRGYLQMSYFSAGRNLLTERIVMPFWVTERAGVPYLTAECQQAHRVLTFRLDRIQALSLVAQ